MDGPQQGQIKNSRQQLSDALNRTDGEPTSLDFVLGTAASEEKMLKQVAVPGKTA